MGQDRWADAVRRGNRPRAVARQPAPEVAGGASAAAPASARGERWRKAAAPSRASRTGGLRGLGPRARGTCRCGGRPRAGARRRPRAQPTRGSAEPSPDPTWGRKWDFRAARLLRAAQCAVLFVGTTARFPSSPSAIKKHLFIRMAFCGVI